jgi:small nuclear ribonucleoprotein (snRNP)-like protein
MPPRDALRALLHSLLHVTLNDGRVLTGHLLAVDSSASLLLSGVRETRILPATEAGANVAQYYPWSRAEGGAAGGLGAGIGGLHGGGDAGGQVREREVASVLVNMRDITAVELGEEDAGAWARFAGVPFEQGQAVPPTPPSPVKA